MHRPLGAQISHMLKARGVEVVFGIPGVHNVELYRGIEEAGLAHVLARHEQGAGFMADGYARATGRPGVAYVITGPGLTNAMTPIGQAWSDSVPLLVIASCLGETAATRGQLHQMRDQEAAGRAVAEWSETARDADAAYALIDRALAEFTSARPRPKILHVPIEALGAPAGSPPPAAQALAGRPVAEAGRVAAMLAQARRPLFIFGGGARAAGDAARRVLAATGAAAFTTYAGRGVVQAGHPLLFGSYLARPSSAEVLAGADLVVAVGTELAEVDLWRAQLGHAAPLVRVDIDPSQLADRHRAEVRLLSDARAFLEDLAAALEGGPARADWSAEEVAAARARWRAEVDAERPGIVPAIEALRAALPRETTIYSDMTQFAYAAKEIWDMSAPGLWHHPYGFGTLGYALPAAIGGKIGLGARPVVAIAGDYGFQYTVQELGVAVELGLSLPVILWDNGKLKEIEDCMTDRQIAPNAVVARNPDFCRLAEAWGAASARPRSLSELGPLLAAAFERRGPTLIHLTAGLG